MSIHTGSAMKRKGTAFESAVVAYLREHGFPYAERRALRGSRDVGDVVGVVGWVLEIKNHRALDLGPWMNEAHAEAANDGVSRFAVIHKRRQHGTAEAFVTLPLRLFAELLRDESPATQRRLEVRIGELLGPAPSPQETGARKGSGATEPLSKDERHDFRQMAAHPEVVEDEIERSEDER